MKDCINDFKLSCFVHLFNFKIMQQTFLKLVWNIYVSLVYLRIWIWRQFNLEWYISETLKIAKK